MSTPGISLRSILILYLHLRLGLPKGLFPVGLPVKITGKRPLGTPRCRWENNIRMDLKEIGINTRNCVDLTQDRDYWRALVNAALNLGVP